MMVLRRLSTRYLRPVLYIMLAICCTACNPFTQTEVHQMPSLQQTATLPGQQIWKDGVSSFLFGTNDTYEWSKKHIENQPEIQQALRDAGFTLVRTFFPDNASDTVIEQRIRTIENIGAHCLGVITNISNIEFNKHLVGYLGKRCSMYEFGNEPDYQDKSMPVDTYLSQWNTQIPQLRQINPDAVFIGPVSFTYHFDGKNDFLRDFLKGVKSSQVLPDAVSFHLYPCFQDSREDCQQKTSQYKQAVESVRWIVKDILGKELPVGVSEWNYDPGNPPPPYGDEEDFISKFSTDALQGMIEGGAAFACQFDAASYSGYGRLDMFDVATNQPKPQFYAIKTLIARYRLTPEEISATATANAVAQANAIQLISRRKTVKCTKDTDGAVGPQAIVDGHYGNWAFWGTNLSALPDSCAIQVGKEASRLMLVWESAYEFDYISDKGMTPQDYTISTSADSTDGVNGTWKTVVTVTGNQTRVRAHVFDFAGQSWVKMTVTKGQANASQPYIRIDEIDLFDVSHSLNQTFFFSGDSITAMSYSRFDDNQPSFPELVHKQYPQYYPAMLNGGMGGWNSAAAVQNIDLWLSLNPDIHYWLVGWGTNDAAQAVPPEQYAANLQVLIDKIKQAGHVPILAHVPYMKKDEATDQRIQAYNDQIEQLTAANGLIAGPDLYTLIQGHAASYLLEDGIHPTPAGGIAMSKAWFEALQAGNVFGA